MKLLLLIASIIVFVLVALLAFFVDSTTARDLIGGIAVGLGVFAASFLPIAP